jgi:hypothetical protein
MEGNPSLISRMNLTKAGETGFVYEVGVIGRKADET